MREYIIALFAISVLISVLRLVGYRGGNMERIALGVICAYVVLSPLGGIGEGDLDGIFDIPEIEVGEGASPVLEEAMAEGICRGIAEEFSLDRSDISVKLFGFDHEKMTAERIEIILSGGAVTADYRAIERYVKDMDIGGVRVEISF